MPEQRHRGLNPEVQNLRFKPGFKPNFVCGGFKPRFKHRFQPRVGVRCGHGHSHGHGQGFGLRLGLDLSVYFGSVVRVRVMIQIMARPGQEAVHVSGQEAALQMFYLDAK